MKKYVVTLTGEEREALDALTSKGKHRSQKILNALILLGCDEGEFQTERSTNEEIGAPRAEHQHAEDRSREEAVRRRRS